MLRILSDWRKLQTSDHFYYMCTKYFADGDVHKYFNPYDSPYDSYINFMNVLDHLQKRCAVTPAVAPGARGVRAKQRPLLGRSYIAYAGHGGAEVQPSAGY